MTAQHLLPGQFGAAARLSPKALRLYAEQGLLVPAYVDPGSGYRYYAHDQLPRARLIARLRRLGLPLARIGYLADLTPEARIGELRGWLRSQRDLLDDRAAQLETFDRLADDNALQQAVTLREIPATKLLCRARQLTTAQLADFRATSERQIRAHLRHSGTPGDGALRLHFHDLVTPDNEGGVEVAVPYEGSVEPVGDLHIRMAPAGGEAYLAVPEKYEDFPLILRVYDAIEAFLDERADLVAVGPPYEIYPGTRARFDVAYPVASP